MADTSPDLKELKANWKTQQNLKLFAKQDVAQHKSKHDLWIIVHGRVYDVTSYAPDHPGGIDALLEVAGQDATSAYEDVGHSNDAGEIMQQYLVGKLEGTYPGSSEVAVGTKQPLTVIHHPGQRNADSQVLSFFQSPQARIIMLLVSVLAIASRIVSTSTRADFLEGFFIACVGTTGVAAVALSFLVKSANTSRDFSSYPSHIASTTARISEYQPSGVLIPSQYSKYKLRSRTEVSEGIYRFTFDLPSKYSVLGLPIGQHVAIRALIGDQTVVRSYTPISNNRDLGRLDFIIRVYPDGQMGNFLKDLKVGDFADMRGPKGAMKYRKGLCREIGMIAGGTGITPMFQLIRAICENDSDNTKVSLVYSSRSEPDIMLRRELDGFAKSSPAKFRVWYMLDKPNPGWTGGTGHFDTATLRKYIPKPAADTKALLCGPPPMVNAAKKILMSELGFEGPGAVSKISDQIFCF